MKQSVEVEYCKNLFYVSSRSRILRIIEDSNLTNKEREFISARYIEGLSIKEICDNLQIEEETYKKSHRKIMSKLYIFMMVNNIT